MRHKFGFYKLHRFDNGGFSIWRRNIKIVDSNIGRAMVQLFLLKAKIPEYLDLAQHLSGANGSRISAIMRRCHIFHFGAEPIK